MSFVIHHGDALAILRTMPDESVNCCVTSPPYFGLRDYGIEGQIGLEPSPAEYVARIVEVFAEVRRVLRTDGTCWINLGDSFANDGKWGGTSGGKHVTALHGDSGVGRGRRHTGLKPKDLIGIPWRVAFALQAAGWWLRSDNIWCKGNCMPESVKDRPTKAHEYVFLLSKSARYFYDQGAVKEPASADTHARYARGRSDNHKYADGGPGKQTIARSLEHMRAPGVHPKAAKPGSGIRANESFSAAVKDIVEMRNMRSWWLINSEPTPESHFATFPLRLAERCILAGCPVDGVVLDPFAGAGTTGLACIKNGRRFIGIELNAEYIRIAEARARKYYPVLMEANA